MFLILPLSPKEGQGEDYIFIFIFLFRALDYLFSFIGVALLCFNNNIQQRKRKVIFCKDIKLCRKGNRKIDM